MASFKLTIVTPEKNFFEGDVERVIVRTTEGDVGILAHHVNYVAALTIGPLQIITEDGKGSKIAAIDGGFITVSKEETVIIAKTCEWAEEIDVVRANAAKQRAEDKIHSNLSDKELHHAQIKLKRALNRISIAEK